MVIIFASILAIPFDRKQVFHNASEVKSFGYEVALVLSVVRNEAKNLPNP